MLERAGAGQTAEGRPGAGPVSPLDVGTRAQLFVERVVVHESRGVAFTLHPAQKHAANPVVQADRPWEGWRLSAYGNVLNDEGEGVFKMWYLAHSPDHFEFPHVTLYAVSEDGVRWEKPLVGTIPALRGEKFGHNAVAQVMNASVMKDNADADPARRYKMVCWIVSPQSLRGYHTMVSPDGLRWTKLSEAPIAPAGDVITAFYDERRGEYVAFPKIRTEVRGHGRRVFYVITSEDFERWTAPELVFVPDLRDDAGSLRRLEEVRPLLDVPDDPALMRTEFYGVGVYPAESCTIAFVWVFTINNNGRFGNQDGPAELQLAASRDLRSWERHFRVPCVPKSRPGEWDAGLNYTQSRALRVGDEVWLYYTGTNYTHADPCLYRAEGTGRGTDKTGRIGLARWRLDRFVSADGPAEGGALTTVPIVHSGRRLEINTATRPRGSVIVEVLDAAGRTIEGIGPSAPFTGDSLRGQVVWPGGPMTVDGLRGRPISLRFLIKDAQLFSFAFRG